MAEKILIIDDDRDLLTLISMTLQQQGFAVHTETDGERGLALFRQVSPDLVILDIGLPAMDGWEVCRRLRQFSAVPIMFLSALDSVEDIVGGLMDGADDYLVKPFQVVELIARVTALLRRSRMVHDQPTLLRFGGDELVINCAEQTVFAHGAEVALSPLEYNLLLYLAERAGRIQPVEHIFDALWGIHSDAGPENVKWYIWRLRKKIEADPRSPQFILTEPGKGYRFSPY